MNRYTAGRWLHRALCGALCVALCGAAAVGCARKDRTPRTAPVAADERAITSPDTARGIVRRVGADPLSSVGLFAVPSRAVPPLALSGVLGTELLAAEGLEVMISGRVTAEVSRALSPGGARVFEVHRFVVRAADGVEAHDGILVAQNGRWYLESAPASRTAIVDLPSALRTQVGARIFLVGPLDRAAQSFGVLRPRQ